MPKCVVCHKMFHPDFCLIVDEINDACKCVWCETGKDEITIENEYTGEPLKYFRREEASEEYLKELRKLAKSPKIAKILVNGENGSP